MREVTITVQVPDHLDREEIEEIQQATQEWVDEQYGDLEHDCL